MDAREVCLGTLWVGFERILEHAKERGQVAELVYALALGASGAILGSSNLPLPTISQRVELEQATNVACAEI